MSRRRPAYRFLPHTADLRLEVRAASLPDLLAESVKALHSLLVDRRSVRSAGERTLHVRGESPEETLFLLLREALLLFALDGYLVRSARVRMEGTAAQLTASGERFDATRHAVRREIKAVTAHGLAVGRDRGSLVARFVVDV